MKNNQEVYYIDRKRLVPFTSEVKRIILAFESRLESEIRYALNCLLIYSCSKHSPFYLDNYRIMFNGLKSFFYALLKWMKKTKYMTVENTFIDENIIGGDQERVLENYSLSSTEILEQFKIVLTIFRNFAFVKTNEALLAKESNLKAAFIEVIIYNNEYEVNKLSLEIFGILSKYTILNVKENKTDKLLLKKVIATVNSDFSEEYELGIENLHNLMMNQENETVLEQNIPLFINQLVRLLISNHLDLVERILEIICHFSDLKISTRVLLAKQDSLFSRLIALLAGNLDKSSEKISKISIIILNNLIVTPATRIHLKMFENDLFLIASTNENM